MPVFSPDLLLRYMLRRYLMSDIVMYIFSHAAATPTRTRATL